mgnify:CR=1 FL=1
MTKRDCTILGLHIILVGAIASGYVCMYKKMKKPKLNINSLDY